MFGPGAYRPDPTEGITAIADLPPPEIVSSSRTYTRQACPRCGHQAYRDKQYQRTLHDLGNLDGWCPRDLVVTYSQHYCTKCQKYFNADLSELAPSGSQYTLGQKTQTCHFPTLYRPPTARPLSCIPSRHGPYSPPTRGNNLGGMIHGLEATPDV